MKSRFRKFFVRFFGILLLLLLIVMFGSSFFADRIGNLVVRELNKSLKHGISVENYDLTMVHYFPNAAVTLKGVQVRDADDKNNLLEAKELAFRFGLFSLFGSEISISSVVIDDGALFVRYDKDGRPNYDILENSDDGSSEGSELQLKLEEAVLKDIELVYVDEQNGHDALVNVRRADMGGRFSGERFALRSSAEFETQFFETAEGRYFLGKKISYQADVDVDLAKEHYQIKDFLLHLEDNKFSIGGEVKRDGKGLLYDLSFDGKDFTLQSLLGMLPEGYVENLIGLKSKGDFTFEGTIKGRAGSRQPAINVRLGLKDGKVSGPQLNAPFRDLTFNATYTNGKNRTNLSSVLEIKDFKGYIAREMVELKLKIQNLDDPHVEAVFTGSIPLDGVYGLIRNEHITDADGDLEIDGLEIRGRYEDMVNPNYVHRVQAKGEMLFDDAMLEYNGEKITIDKGKLTLDGNTLALERLRIEGLGSDISFTGTTRNLIPVMLSDSVNSKEAQLKFNLELKADELDIERWMGLSPVPEEGEVSEEEFDSLKSEQYSRRESMINFLDGSFQCDIGNFSYGKIKGEGFDGKLTVKDKQVILDGGLEAMGGRFDLDGIIYMYSEPRLKAKLICAGINGTEFFRQTDNFGQDVLTYKNIKGAIDANIAVNAYWSKEGDFIADKLEILADTHIKDGELKDFKMLESFSTFVKMRDLRHIHFTDTRNWFQVEKGVFYLPVMFIQSNALNLTMSGRHTFQQEIDYNVKVNAGQVLVKKLFKRPGNKPIKARNGWFNLYYKIKGDLDDYEMDSAKRQIKQEFEESERRKKRIQQKLEREFGTIDRLTEIESQMADE